MNYTNAQERALDLLATGTSCDGRFHLHFYGPANKAKRAAVMAALAGRKVSKSDALWGAFFGMLADNFAPGVRGSIAEIESAIINAIGQYINRGSIQYKMAPR